MRDEHYIIGLCDQVLGRKSSRQHRFDFLVGDPNKRGRTRRLPVDAFYPDLDLVVEYHERQHSEPVKIMDARMTLSGCTRGEQRRLYDQRRLLELPKHKKQYIVLDYSMFAHDGRKVLRRNPEVDLKEIRRRLRPYLNR